MPLWQNSSRTEAHNQQQDESHNKQAHMLGTLYQVVFDGVALW